MRASPRAGSAFEVLIVFLRLGLTSFGGPIAHIGYFHKAFVTERHWLSEAQFADLLALCQFLPGPSSSQTGFAIGFYRAGLGGAFAAFLGFTLPSALIMGLAGLSALSLSAPQYHGLFHGLKLVALAVIAQALWAMYHALCPDRARSLIAIAALGCMALLPPMAAMAGSIAVGALLGLALKPAASRAEPLAPLPFTLPKAVALLCLLLVLALLVLLPFSRSFGAEFALFDSLFRAGALVFGGGHVLLPLLQSEFLAQEAVSPEVFLAGYGLAQAMPGPLFSIAAYLGAVTGGAFSALLATLAIFASGFLLLLGVLPFWAQWRNQPSLRRAMLGTNAAVVGILGAVYFTMLSEGGLGFADLALVLALWAALGQWRLPLLLVVAIGAAAGMAQYLL